ncbi:MAG: glycosyltransferase, partial [Thermoleophilia bacterium]|nr:glycosyltransferase [Thermoleophilia bacterium]
MLTTLCLVSLALAAVPALLFLDNLRQYLPPRLPAPGAPTPSVSVLIPARNEEASIAAAVESALASEGVDLEVVVLDDHSTDATADLVRAIMARDGRVRLETAPELPPGWCGKQHACHALAGLATRPVLVFVDADVRLAPDGLARASAFLDASRADLVSGIPRQITVGWLEQLVIPLIHFVLLGFLPMRRMRAYPDPGYAAGCGQLFITRKGAYDRMGGHATIRTTLHDGIKLPRAYRAAGLATDLFDATDVARCRMYGSARDVWFGLAKNATEGLASPAMIGPATLLL